MTGFIDIVFDGPPGATSGRFVEVENSRRESINCGEWMKRDDDYWVLRVPQASEQEYLCTAPDLPEGASSPVMDHQQMTDWLNNMALEGWDFVGYGQTNWRGAETFTQEWWIFRRER